MRTQVKNIIPDLEHIPWHLFNKIVMCLPINSRLALRCVKKQFLADINRSPDVWKDVLYATKGHHYKNRTNIHDFGFPEPVINCCLLFYSKMFVDKHYWNKEWLAIKKKEWKREISSTLPTAKSALDDNQLLRNEQHYGIKAHKLKKQYEKAYELARFYELERLKRQREKGTKEYHFLKGELKKRKYTMPTVPK